MRSAVAGISLPARTGGVREAETLKLINKFKDSHNLAVFTCNIMVLLFIILYVIT